MVKKKNEFDTPPVSYTHLDVYKRQVQDPQDRGAQHAVYGAQHAVYGAKRLLDAALEEEYLSLIHI